MLMAIYLKGLSNKEVSSLTRDMRNSGTTLTWPEEWRGRLVDKHSTGGVGDKVSLVLAPALAAFGLKVPMISGRGLAHTGGTLDKLEAVPGFRCDLTFQEMTDILGSVGCFISGQTKDICPADKKTYAVRDVTATVDDIGLITASIVSKKAAENIHALVLDVKTGSGAFITDKSKAAMLAKSMVSCSESLGTKTVALLTDMDSPIGNMVGNALEVIESIQCLQGKGPKDLLDLTVSLGGHLLHAGKFVKNVEEGCKTIQEKINNGEALARFCSMLKGQGVNKQLADDLCDPNNDPRSFLPKAKSQSQLCCPSAGYVQRIDAMDVAVAAHKLGAGRNSPGEPVNWAVGLELLVDVGDQVTAGQAWVKVHHDSDLSDEIIHRLTKALFISQSVVDPRTSRVQEVIEGNNVTEN
ncbi:thymidine phosphorylase-like isoform X2 [Physella acuta]|nr:thymidine phosphorylase-like isoform X2 [Physella acuta]